jgi:hypothetical protein
MLNTVLRNLLKQLTDTEYHRRQQHILKELLSLHIVWVD